MLNNFHALLPLTLLPGNCNKSSRFTYILLDLTITTSTGLALLCSGLLSGQPNSLFSKISEDLFYPNDSHP